MKSWFGLALFLVTCKEALTAGLQQTSEEECNVVCGHRQLSSILLSSNDGDPGPRGHKGAMGPPGLPGESCQCESVAELVTAVSNLQLELELVKRCAIAGNCTLLNTTLARSCLEYQQRSGTALSSGTYTISPDGQKNIQVYCDLRTGRGGWTVLQRRMDGSENFRRQWDDYVRGFGDINGEFWLGLDNIYELTKNGDQELRVDMEDFDGNRRYAKYSSFSVGPPSDKYRVLISGYSGDASDSMTSMNAHQFSTSDQDNDGYPDGSCSLVYRGGWWYDNCHESNPNGLYLGGAHESYADGVNWRHWRGYHYSLKFIDMKIRKKQ